MVKKMKAAINYGPNDLRLEEIDIPIASQGEIIAKVLLLVFVVVMLNAIKVLILS